MCTPPLFSAGFKEELALPHRRGASTTASKRSWHYRVEEALARRVRRGASTAGADEALASLRAHALRARLRFDGSGPILVGYERNPPDP